MDILGQDFVSGSEGCQDSSPPFPLCTPRVLLHSTACFMLFPGALQTMRVRLFSLLIISGSQLHVPQPHACFFLWGLPDSSSFYWPVGGLCWRPLLTTLPLLTYGMTGHNWESVGYQQWPWFSERNSPLAPFLYSLCLFLVWILCFVFQLSVCHCSFRGRFWSAILPSWNLSLLFSIV